MSSDIFKAKTYGVAVGDLWVAIDFEAQAVAVSRAGVPRTTEDLGDGFLIDRNTDGRIIAVEILGGNP